VKGLTYRGKDEGLQLLLRVTDQINRECGTNYQIAWRSLQAAEHGVPQLRERVFLVGQREGLDFTFPAPKFTDPDACDSQPSLFPLEPYRTAWDALGDLPEPNEDLSVKGWWGDLLPSIPEGNNYLWHTDRKGGLNLFGWRTRYWSFLLKLAKNRPSWTIQAQPGSSIGPFHWKNRRLSVREMCRIQTFPDDFKLVGGRTSTQRQLGNAVPSLLAEILGLEIRRQLLGCNGPKRPPRLLPRKREPIPAPERRRPVRKKYLSLVGDHPAHPGEGKGGRARASAE
jgi:DNA (cytosine-5)-methyltransferase 1